MATNLPTDIDATYPDRDPGDKYHQQVHDAIHAYTNSHDTAPDPHGDRAYADAVRIGGVYTSPSSAMSYGTPTVVPLATTTGDNYISGNGLLVPVGGDGLWSLSATWMTQVVGGNYGPVRAFINIRKNGATSNTSPDIWRGAVPKDEDRATITAAAYLVAGDLIECSVYWAAAPGEPVSNVALTAYRVGR